MKSKLLLMLTTPILCIGSLNAQLSRGPTPGELYITGKYAIFSDDASFTMLIYTHNHGRNFTQKCIYQDESDNTYIEQVLADATPGVLYNNVQHTLDTDKHGLYRSMDDGESWEFVSDLCSQNESFTTGNIENEIFRKSQGVIYKSLDNGDSWIQTNDSMVGRIEVGNQQGEIYVNKTYGNDPIDLTIYYSANEGGDFVGFEIDTAIAGYYVSGHGPVLSRGAIPGELYLISWWYPANYKIFRSTDHGQSFFLQYEQPDTCYFWDEGYHFTAGREEGEFYIVKRKTLETDDWNLITRFHIFYSNDYAQSFSEYIHILDDNFDGIPIQIIHSISASVNPDDAGTVEGVGKYDEGKQVDLVATPANGYEFFNWTEGGIVISHEATLSFTVESTRTLNANFQLTNSIPNPDYAGISLYPNPANGLIKLCFQQFQTYSKVVFEIFSIDGRELISKPIHRELSTHDISNLPIGMYLYRFTADGFIIKTGKIIIN